MSESIKLTPDLQRIAEEQVNAGNFRSVAEATRAAFWLLRENTEKRAQVRSELAGRFKDLDEGKGIRRTQTARGRLAASSSARAWPWWRFVSR